MHNAAICSPICINQFDGARPFSSTPRVYIFVQRTDACPILVRIPHETCGDVNISVIDTFWPAVASCSARSENRASRFRIGILLSGDPSVCVPAVCVKHIARTCVPACVCAHLRHVGSLFVPRAERPAVSASLVLFVSLRPSPTQRYLTTTTITTTPLPRLHASIASMRVSIDALRARRE